jgi:hypothetical protein
MKTIALLLLLVSPAFAGVIKYQWDPSPGTVDGYAFCPALSIMEPAPLTESCARVSSSTLTYTYDDVAPSKPICATVYAFAGGRYSGPSNTVCLQQVSSASNLKTTP